MVSGAGARPTANTEPDLTSWVVRLGLGLRPEPNLTQAPLLGEAAWP